MADLRLVDLRSDTLTRPDAAMRRAMAEAEVGDDVLGEDPTVRELELRAADRVGKEAALFVPSGTMGNEIALHLHGRPGTEVICEATSHIVAYEMAGMAALSGLLPRLVRAERGVLTPELVEAAISPDVSYQAPTGLLSLENTSNMAGGCVCPPDLQSRTVAVARRHGLPVHLDGARIFNAAVALELEPSQLTAPVDSVMFCLSKGLGAPVGSMLCGTKPFIVEARRIRKMFGGGMRQVGVLAAAGLIALRHGPMRLAEDHENAARLGRALSQLPGVALLTPVETNIVIVDLSSSGVEAEPVTTAVEFVRRMGELGLLGIPIGPHRVRFVTHRDVDRDAFNSALERLGAVVEGP
jgi:threonine aldolase